ncbi:unnamed protein product [Caenorhabditis brenneri]
MRTSQKNPGDTGPSRDEDNRRQQPQTRPAGNAVHSVVRLVRPRRGHRETQTGRGRNERLAIQTTQRGQTTLIASHSPSLVMATMVRASADDHRWPVHVFAWQGQIIVVAHTKRGAD